MAHAGQPLEPSVATSPGDGGKKRALFPALADNHGNAGGYHRAASSNLGGHAAGPVA